LYFLAISMPTKGVSGMIQGIEVMAGPPEWDLSHTLRSYESATSHGFFLMYYGSEFTATAVREWLERVGVNTLFIEPGSPWENGYVESFNGKLRDELLNGEIFYTLQEAQVIIEHRALASGVQYLPAP
jgi:transposase InsO family protein